MTAPSCPAAARRSRAAASASLAGAASSAVDGAIRPQPVRVTVLVDMARILLAGGEAHGGLPAGVATAIMIFRVRSIILAGVLVSLAALATACTAVPAAAPAANSRTGTGEAASGHPRTMT